MIKLDRILVPTDFSEFSAPAITYACAFAEKFGSEIHLLHVVQDLVALVPEPGLAFPPPGDYMREMQSAAKQTLERQPGDQLPDGVNVVRTVRQGPAFVEIIRYARESAADLLIMGTHGRSGLTHVLLGSVTEKVVRKSPCPVLTVRPDEHQFVMP